MAQHDYVIDNSTGANVRTDINNVLQAIATNNSGSSDPSTTVASQFFADTNAGIMKLRNTANNGYVNLFNLAGGINVDANSNFSGDVSFDGTGDQNITFDKSASSFIFNDNAKAKFGSGDDLQLYHDSNNSLINASGTGNLIVQGANDIILRPADGEVGININANGGVELYHDNSKKFQTIANGNEFFGQLKNESDGTANGIYLGASNDLQLYHDSNSIIANSNNSVNLILQSDNFTFRANSDTTEKFFKATKDGAVELYHDGSKKFETRSDGAAIPVDGNGLKIGANNDVRLYHETNNWSYLVHYNTSGNLGIESVNDIVIRNINGEKYIYCNEDGAVELYHDGTVKVLTTSTGLQMASEQKILFTKEHSTSGSIIAIDFDKNNPSNNVGDISFSNSAVTYNTGSDYRLKQNERPIDDAIEKVKLLKPYYFNFIETPEILSQGFYAHEVSNVVPTAVKGEKDQVALNGMPIYQKLDHSKIVPMLAAGLKALIEKVEKLEAA